MSVAINENQPLGNGEIRQPESSSGKIDIKVMNHRKER